MRTTWGPAVCLLAALVVLVTTACGGAASGPAGTSNTVALRDFQPASIVFGQPIFALNESNQGQPTPGPHTLSGCGKPALAGLYVPDVNNHRVLGFHATPIISNLSASFVLGQPGFTFAFPGVGPTALNEPIAAVVAGNALLVADQGNHRIVIWHNLPTANGAGAKVAIGQPDLFTRDEGAGRAGLRSPAGISVGGGRIAVADRGNHRVLIYDGVPVASGVQASVVVGQGDFDTTTPNRGTPRGPTTLADPISAWTDGQRLVVADRGNHRVLIWNQIPTAPGVPADIVLGQADFVSASPAGGPTGMNRPADVCSNGTQLFVADAGNHRVLIWDRFPTASRTAPDRVLGQGDFFHTTPNDDNQDGVQDPAASARTLHAADEMLTIHVYGAQLFVGDTGNNRVLIFDGQ